MFSICLILPATLGPWDYSASNGNEYQKKEKKIIFIIPYDGQSLETQ
jgi:hypothetical protein